jgi:hypothetical protein
VSAQAKSSAIAGRVSVLSRQLDLTQGELGDLLRASQRSVSRWASGDATPQRESKVRLLELAYIADQLGKLVKPEDANLWLYSPNKLLKGESPAELIRRGEFRKVLGLVEALSEGVIV